MTSYNMHLIQANLNQIKHLVKKHKGLGISVFGSVARGADTFDSDIDFLVDFAPDASLLDQAGLLNDLTDLLKCKVDVISRGGLRPTEAHILKDEIPL